MKHTEIIVSGIMIAAIAMMIMPVSAVLAQTNPSNETQVTTTNANPGTSTPILGGVANLQVTKNNDNQLTVEVTKATKANETTVISENGTVTEVPGGNVTIVNNGTVVVAPNDTEVTTTPTNVTVVIPPNATNPTQPCTCNQSNQSQQGNTIPPVQVIPAPGQNVTINKPAENNTNVSPNPMPPISNNTGPVPPFTNPTNNQTAPNNGTEGNQTNPANPAGNNTAGNNNSNTNPINTIISGLGIKSINYHPVNSWPLHA